MQYLYDKISGKTYTEDTLSTVHAVDPNHFDTDIQNLQDQVVTLQAQIDNITNVQIPAKQAEKDEFLAFQATIE